MISFGDQATFRPFLLPGERVLWTGRPQQGLVFDRFDLLSLPSLLVAGAALVWLTRERGLPDLPDMVSAALLLLGLLYAGFGRFLHEAWARRRLLYAVTNQRVLTLHGKKRIDSYDLAWLPMLELEQKGRRGTITIEGPPSSDGVFESIARRVSPFTPGFRFFRVEDPAALYDLICRESARRRADLNRDLSLGYL